MTPQFRRKQTLVGFSLFLFVNSQRERPTTRLQVAAGGGVLR